MKKVVLILILILAVVSGISGQTAPSMDLVVILDTSASMSSSYRETSDYLIGPFLREFLRLGDTFHLISFSQSPRLEISRRIESVGDVETVIGRLLLMYPLDTQTNVAGALSYGEQYARSLPGSRPRKIILISDGDAANTQTLVSESSSRLRNSGTELQYIKVPVTGTGPSSGRPQPQVASRSESQTSQPGSGPSAATQVTPSSPSQSSYTTTPGTPAAPAQGGQYSSQEGPYSSGQTTPGGTSSQSYPSQSGTTPRQSGPSGQGETIQSGTASGYGQGGTTPGQSGPYGQGGTTPGQSGVTGETGEGGEAPSEGETPPEGTEGSGDTRSEGETAGPGSGITYPPSSTSSSSSRDGLPSFIPEGLPLPILIGLIILALLILGLLIFLITRRLHNSPNIAMAKATAPEDSSALMGSYAEQQRRQARGNLEYPPKDLKPLPRDKAYDENDFSGTNGDPVMLNLFVEDQNTAIGRRNIHVVKAGGKFTVGGGSKSDEFWIFLVPVPQHIADVTYDGKNCTFIPRKPQYFPDIGSQTVYSCIGKTIRVISDKNYELHIRMERYQDPLKALNKLLRSISVPGEVIL